MHGKMSNEELAERIKNGERDLILTLWKQVRNLIVKIIFQRYLPRDGSNNLVEVDDLIQAGFIGMMKAIHDFRSSSGYAFTTFLNKHLANAAREALGIRSEKRDPLLDAVSLDKPIASDQDGDLTLGETLYDKTFTYVYDDLIEDVAKKEDIRIIYQQLNILSPRERELFEARYTYGLSFAAIGEKYGFTRQYTNDVTKRALWKIRNTKAVRQMAKERYVDSSTRFYAKKGIKAFKTTFSSAVEDSVIMRELLEKIYLSNQGLNRDGQ